MNNSMESPWADHVSQRDQTHFRSALHLAPELSNALIHFGNNRNIPVGGSSPAPGLPIPPELEKRIQRLERSQEEARGESHCGVDGLGSPVRGHRAKIFNLPLQRSRKPVPAG
jgi:hypothetical protein